jgi:hypothetical protein
LQYVRVNGVSLMAVLRLHRIMSSFVGIYAKTLGSDGVSRQQLSLKWFMEEMFFVLGFHLSLKLFPNKRNIYWYCFTFFEQGSWSIGSRKSQQIKIVWVIFWCGA